MNARERNVPIGGHIIREESFRFCKRIHLNGKFSEIRLTGLAAGNGVDEKLPMLVIGIAEKPRCFKYQKPTLSV